MAAFYNLQDNEIAVPPNVEAAIIASTERWLTAREMHLIFRHRNLFPVSLVTPAETPGLFRVLKGKFTDENEWFIAPHGHGVTTSHMLEEGVRTFNYTLAQNQNLSRRTIRRRERYGINTFVHYL